LFVSHQMSAISSLCNRVLLLGAGAVLDDGPSNEVISQYLARTDSFSETVRDLRDFSPRKGTGELMITKAEINAFSETEKLPVPRMGDTLAISFEVENRAKLPGDQVRLSVAIKAINGQKLIHISNEDDSYVFPNEETATIRVELPHLKLYPGIYTITLWVGSSKYEHYDWVEDCMTFEVGMSAVSPRAFKTDWSQGFFLHSSKWVR